MGRRERRESEFIKKKSNSKFHANKRSIYDESNLLNKILWIGIPIILIVYSVYEFSTASVLEKDLTSIEVNLTTSPEFEEFDGKSSEKTILLKTKQYQKPFIIRENDRTFEAINKNDILKTFMANDRIILKIKKSDLDNINEASFLFKFTSIYGIYKNGISFLDLNIRNQIAEQNKYWNLLFTGGGFLTLIIVFIKFK